jgi:dsRNA-specific ribonuclease
MTFTKLKFLGMRVLGLLVSDLLFATDSFNSEGDLTVAHSQILKHDGLIVKGAADISVWLMR